MSRSLSGAIKLLAKAQNESNQPCDLRFGTVISVSPLKIQVTNSFILNEDDVIVPEKLTDYRLNVTMDWDTTYDTHTHNISDTYTGGGSASNYTHNHYTVGTKSLLIHNALKVGDNVALIRSNGGQIFYILDRF